MSVSDRAVGRFDTIIVVPHTHWDREWYEPVARTRQRLVAVIDDLMDRLEAADDVEIFLIDGQLAVVDDYLDVRSERRAAVANLVGAGRLLVGPWYVLADELMTGAEAMVRNLLAGRRLGRELGGWMPVGYSPDAFGHPATLPTLLAGFGIEDAIVWRGYGGAPDHVASLFRWESPDGSAVRTFHLPPDGYEFGAELPEDPDALREAWTRIRSALADRHPGRTAIVMNGADHHALQPGIARVVAELRDLEPGADVRFGSPRDFFAACPDLDGLNTVRGELRDSAGYTWSLPGVAATRASMKASIAEGERLLVRWAEPQSALAGADRRPLLRHAWRDHLRSCAHDSLGGCCDDDVARDVLARATGVSRAARGILVDALSDRLQQDRTEARRRPEAWLPTLVLANPSPWERGGVVEATLAVFRRDVKVGGPDSDQPAPTLDPGLTPTVAFGDAPARIQVLHHYLAHDRFDSPRDYPDQDVVQAVRVAIEVPPVPSLGIRCGRVGEGDRVDETGRDWVRATARTLASPHFRIRGVRSTGFQARLLESRATYEEFARLESLLDVGDTYTSDEVTGSHPAVARMGAARVEWDGPLVAAIARDFEIRRRVVGTVFLRLDVGSRLIRVAIDGENLTGDHKLRIVFPGAGPEAVADMPFGPVTRPRVTFDERDHPDEWPATTAPAHRFVSSGRPGITIFPRDRFEYELLPADEIAMTIFRATGQLSRSGLRARAGHAGWPVPTPDAQELGPFRAEFGVRPRGVEETAAPADWDAIERAAEEFHQPVAGWMLRQALDPPVTVAGPRLEGPGLSFSCLTRAEEGDAVVVRCVNVNDAPVSGAWRWHRPVTRAVLARLDETPIGEIVLGGDRAVIPFEARARGVTTILVWS